jgi:diguanylate cyclase (GGDEF)-like protein/PAS domain S-box-containing protein
MREALRISENRYRRLFETAQDGIILLNAESAQIEDVNPFLIHLLGYSHQEFLGKKIWEVGPFANIVQSKDMFKELQIKGYVRYEDLPLKTKQGEKVQVEFVSNSYECEGIKVIQCNIRDITKRKEADVKTQRHIFLYAALSQCNKAILHCTDKEQLFTQICRAAVNFGGMKMAFVGLIDEDTQMLHSEVSYGDVNEVFRDITMSSLSDSTYGRGSIGIAIREKRPVWCQDFMHDPLTLPWRRLAEQAGWASTASLPLFQNNSVVGVFVLYSAEINAFDEDARNLLIEMSRDISFVLDNLVRETERIAAADEIEKLAFYDPLTGLPNRRQLHKRLLQRLTNKALQNRYGAVLMLDLDNFKNLNDTMGHNIGDLLLIEVATRLLACVSKADTVTRLGGDEFIVIVAELDKAQPIAILEAEAVGVKILEAISKPYLLKGNEYHSSTSIGISLFINHDSTEAELLKRTDTAMYQAKSAGGNTSCFYNPAMQVALELRSAMKTDLHRALKDKQLSLFYQIQVDKKRHIFGAEALLRWRHPMKGLISPKQFIPLAEEMGLIVNIGTWVLEMACAQLQLWKAVPLFCDLQLAVNVSVRQIFQPDFVEQVIIILTKSAIDPCKLKLELTESVVMDNIDEIIIKMHALRSCGVRFSLDDFGTGYSSLSYLTQLPLDQLKIDQSFVRNIGVKTKDAVIAQTIIGMAHNLGLEVIAEGVETETQLAFLEQHGCWHFQGYLFSKPVPIVEFEHLLLSQTAG